MALTKISTDGFKDDAVTTDKLANAINTERTANTAKTSTTINNNADNRVITGSGTANTLEGEANLTYDGTRLNVGTGDLAVTGAEGGDAQLRLTADEGDDGADYWRLESKASDNKFNLATYASGAWVDKVTVDSSGNVGIGTTSPQKTLVAKGNIAQSVNASGNPSNDQTLGVFGFLPNAGASNYSCGIQGQAVGTQSGSANPSALLFFTKPSSIGPGSNPTESARIDSDGLKFNGDTAAANGLDDYEEGTWTPSVGTYGGVTGTRSFSRQNGYYVKIGRMVFCWMDWVIDSWSGGTGSATVYGLPFSKSFEGSLSAYYSGLTVWWASNTVTGSKANITGWIAENESHYRLYVSDTGESSQLSPNFTGRVAANFVYTTSS